MPSTMIGLLAARATSTLLLSGLLVLTFPAIAQSQRLEIVPPADPAVFSVYRGRDSVEIRKVRMTGADAVDIEKVWSRYQSDGEVPPDGTPDVDVLGLENVTLERDQEVDLVLLFPSYPKTATYSAALFFKRKGGPEAGEKFYAYRVVVLEPSGALPRRWAKYAGILAFVLPIVILGATIFVRGPDGRNFFQSPDPARSYSVSRFQVWLWTIVVIFAYLYLYFTQGPNIPFPDSIWGLLGISVGSIGVATALATKAGAPAGGNALATATAPAAAAPVSPTATPATATSLISGLQSMLSEDGHPSIMRLQMLAWTVATAIVFVRQVYATGMLWDVPSSLLVLMGISHTGYLVDKGVSKPPPGP